MKTLSKKKILCLCDLCGRMKKCYQYAIPDGSTAWICDRCKEEK